MKVLHGLEAVDPPLAQSVLTVGNFDGVHRAHQQLLAQAGLFAANTGGPVVVLTFEPHPLSVVAPEKAPPRLSTPQQKLRCLAEAGADMTVIARRERSLRGLEADTAVELSILISLPAIAGASVLELLRSGGTDAVAWAPLAIGVAAAFATGVAALHALRWVVRTRRLLPFAAYCALLGTGALFLG